MQVVDEKEVLANPMTLGRSYSVDLPLIFADVSRTHLKVYFQNGEIFIEDLNSKNGTFLNGEKIEPNKLVAYKEGDRIALGKTEETLTLRAVFVEQKKTEDIKRPVPLVKPDSDFQSPPPLSAVTPRKTGVVRPAVQVSHPQKQLIENEIQQLKSELTQLRAHKETLVGELQEHQKNLDQIKAEVVEVEDTWRTKTSALVKEQSEIKHEFERDLLEMKALFDSKKTELDSVERELSELKSARQSLETETEDFFIARQNELLKEREELESLKERRVLEVEMEMAQMMSTKIRGITPVDDKIAADLADHEELLEIDAEDSGFNPWRMDFNRAMATVAVVIVFGLAWIFSTKTTEQTDMASLTTKSRSPQQEQGYAAWRAELKNFITTDLKLDAAVAEKYLKNEESWTHQSQQFSSQMTELLEGSANYAKLLAHREKFFRNLSSK